jgi:hypothetical protein
MGFFMVLGVKLIEGIAVAYRHVGCNANHVFFIIKHQMKSRAARHTSVAT